MDAKDRTGPFEGFPFILGWELTLECNLRCVHCGSSAGKRRVRELTIPECLDVCSQFPALMVQEVNFTGGEPLMYRGWEKVVNDLVSRSIRVRIISNGLLLTRGLIAKVHGLGVESMGLSLDGTQATHDSLRGHEGLYMHVLNCMDWILESGLDLTVLTTVSGINLPEIEGIHETLVSRGVRNWQVQPIFPWGRSLSNSNLRLTEEDYLTLGRTLHKYGTDEGGDGLRVMPADSFGYYTEMDTRMPSWGGCPAGIASCGITSNGDIKGCLSMPDELSEGNLRDRDLWDIWFDPGSFQYTRRFQNEDLGPNCRNCMKAPDCLGGCSTMSYTSTGRFHNDPFCLSRLTDSNLPTVGTSGPSQL